MATRAEHASRPNRESLSKRLGKVAKQIKARDDHRCVYCHRTAEESGAHLHLDHLVPRSAGGADQADNLVLACRSCNTSRQDDSVAAFCRRVGVNPRRIWAQARRPLPELSA